MEEGTVGRGYAFGDEDYWNYLLDLADWKKSDPYYKSGQLTVEKPGLANAPEGIDTRMLKPEVAAALAGVRA